MKPHWPGYATRPFGVLVYFVVCSPCKINALVVPVIPVVSNTEGCSTGHLLSNLHGITFCFRHCHMSAVCIRYNSLIPITYLYPTCFNSYECFYKVKESLNSSQCTPAAKLQAVVSTGMVSVQSDPCSSKLAREEAGA